MRQRIVNLPTELAFAVLLIINPEIYAQPDAARPHGNIDPSLQPVASINRVYVSRHDGSVEDAIDAMPDRAILVIDIPDGVALLSAGRALSPGQFVANEPGCYITGTGSGVLTIDRPS